MADKHKAKRTGTKVAGGQASALALATIPTMLQVPANQIGHAAFPSAELKTMQEVITPLAFAVFSTLYPKEPLGWTLAVVFCFIALGAWFVVHEWA